MTIERTDNTYTIHHFAVSWTSPYYRFKQNIKRILGGRITVAIIKFKHFIKEKLLHRHP